MNKREEAQAQEYLIEYIKLQYPNVIFCAQIAGLNIGARLMQMAKRLGYWKGFPDLLIMEPKGVYHGLAIEMKKEGKYRLTIEQESTLSALSRKGYYAVVADGFEKAKMFVDNYLSLKI